MTCVVVVRVFGYLKACLNDLESRSDEKENEKGEERERESWRSHQPAAHSLSSRASRQASLSFHRHSPTRITRSSRLPPLPLARIWPSMGTTRNGTGGGQTAGWMKEVRYLSTLVERRVERRSRRRYLALFSVRGGGGLGRNSSGR
jgi:hypothetical protein